VAGAPPIKDTKDRPHELKSVILAKGLVDVTEAFVNWWLSFQNLSFSMPIFTLNLDIDHTNDSAIFS
jgi:hypothetical protein